LKNEAQKQVEREVGGGNAIRNLTHWPKGESGKSYPVNRRGSNSLIRS